MSLRHTHMDAHMRGHTLNEQKHHSEPILRLIQNNSILINMAAYITVFVQGMKGLVTTPIIVCKFTLRGVVWPFD